MKDKIVQLMKSEGLTSSRLAEILEIQPSGISHLVSGRNKPGFDLLQKILRRFPNINPYWLMLDDQEMYRRSETENPKFESSNSHHVEHLEINATPTSPWGGYSQHNTEYHDSVHDAESTPIDLFSPPQTLEKNRPQPSELGSMVSSKIDLREPTLKRVILLYDDGHCESYTLK